MDSAKEPKPYQTQWTAQKSLNSTRHSGQRQNSLEPPIATGQRAPVNTKHTWQVFGNSRTGVSSTRLNSTQLLICIIAPLLYALHGIAGNMKGKLAVEPQLLSNA